MAESQEDRIKNCYFAKYLTYVSSLEDTDHTNKLFMNVKEQLLLNKINAVEEQNLWLKQSYYQLCEDMKFLLKKFKEVKPSA